MRRHRFEKEEKQVEHVEVDRATAKRVFASTMRKYARTFKLLAAYDRGEYTLPDGSNGR